MTTIYVLVVLLCAPRAFSSVQAIHVNNDTQADRVSSTGVGMTTGNTHARLGIPVRMNVLKQLDIPGDPTNPVSVPVIRRIQVGPRNPVGEDFRTPGGMTLTGNRLSNPTLWRNPNSMSRVPIPIQGARGPLRPDFVGQHGGDSPFLEGRRVSGTGRDVHVDMPGQHGNLSPNPVVHRELTGGGGQPERHVAYREQPVTDAHTEVHIDLPGEHGNDSPHPVVHRPSPTSGGRREQPPDPHIQTDLDGVFRHQENQTSIPNEGFVSSSLSAFEHHGSSSSGIGQPIGFRREHSGGSGNTHVDLPGEHGNESPFPVVHRASEERGKVHVDLPGQHGNNSPHPVLHREGNGNSDSRPAQRSTDVHVDMPGQHGNLSPHPVVHRDGSGHTSNGPPHSDTDVHVDLPGRQGNEFPHPVVQRERGAPEALLGSPSGNRRLPVQTGEHSTQSVHGRSMETFRQFPGDFGVGDRFFGRQMPERVQTFPPMFLRMPMGPFPPYDGDRFPLPPPFMSFDRPFRFFRRGFMPGGHFPYGGPMGQMFMAPFRPFRGFW